MDVVAFGIVSSIIGDYRSQNGKPMVLVAVTGWGQDDGRRLAQEAGFDHYLVKPVDIAALRRLLAAGAACGR